MPRSLVAVAGALLAALAAVALPRLAGGTIAAADRSALTPSERAAIIALGPWPPAPIRDDGNPASGQPAGIALGESLFYGQRLSATGLRCASCHEPWRHFIDGRLVAQGIAAGSRNTPSLLDAARHRHYGWDGARDALWQQSLRPLQDPREMPASQSQVAAALRGDAALSTRYAAVFGAAPGDDDARVTRDVGLALAAYVETLATPRTPFDAWRDQLAQDADDIEPSTSDAFPAAARRGLRLFVGRAGCSACHSGPTLSDDAPHVSLVHSMTAPGVPDSGRAASSMVRCLMRKDSSRSMANCLAGGRGPLHFQTTSGRRRRESWRRRSKALPGRARPAADRGRKPRACRTCLDFGGRRSRRGHKVAETEKAALMPRSGMSG